MVQYLGIVCSMVYLVITLQLKGDKDRLVIFTSWVCLEASSVFTAIDSKSQQVYFVIARITRFDL